MSNGIEWGSVADWVSGGGSLLAVIAALIIAFIEWRRARRAEQAVRSAVADKQNALIDEAVRIADQMIWLCNDHLEDAQRAPDTVDKDLSKSFLSDMIGIADQIDSLRKFPNDDPRLYVELGKLRRRCDFKPKWMLNAEIAECELGDRLVAVKASRDTLVKLRLTA